MIDNFTFEQFKQLSPEEIEFLTNFDCIRKTKFNTSKTDQEKLLKQAFELFQEMSFRKNENQ